MPTATSFPSTCAATIVTASDCVGFTLPGMIELPGSFSGIRISQRPARGPDASQRTSFAIFVERRRERLEPAVQRDQRLVAGERRELVRRALERQPGDRGDLMRAPLARIPDAC